MKKWVEKHVATKGYETADAFFLEMLRREKAMEAREEVERILVDALDEGPATPMTAKDWERIRTAGLKRARELRKK